MREALNCMFTVNLLLFLENKMVHYGICDSYVVRLLGSPVSLRVFLRESVSGMER